MQAYLSPRVVTVGVVWAPLLHPAVHGPRALGKRRLHRRAAQALARVGSDARAVRAADVAPDKSMLKVVCIPININAEVITQGTL